MKLSQAGNKYVIRIPAEPLRKILGWYPGNFLDYTFAYFKGVFGIFVFRKKDALLAWEGKIAAPLILKLEEIKTEGTLPIYNERIKKLMRILEELIPDELVKVENDQRLNLRRPIWTLPDIPIIPIDKKLLEKRMVTEKEKEEEEEEAETSE